MCENEPDSEDDFEGYFLKPVNEYNIVDRIKNANEELFASPQPPSPSVLNRKVKFREILEDYEPKGEIVTNIKDSVESLSEDARVDDSEMPLGCESVDAVSDEHENSDVSVSDEDEIEEICEEVDSLEVQDPISDCEKSLSNDHVAQEDENAGAVETASTSARDHEPLTSSSLSTEDLPSVIEVFASELELRTRKQDKSDEHSKRCDASDKEEARVKSPREKQRKIQKPEYGSDVLKLRLHYRTCCEYKNSLDNLPRYSGFFSQYGLTKEQWERRQNRWERNRKKFVEKSVIVAETENKKMEDNERAFTSWLKNKMRFPINKTKNMFDFKASKLKRKKKPV